ncbi:MAG: DUF4835 family protein [Sphingobacteriales bacterium]|nr:MAG: DUF4835 family protein [Sphingobacteriales bacterium]
MLKKLFSIAVLCALSLTGMAQELNCKVKVMYERIQGVDKQVFLGMERAITEFMNTRKWTNDQYSPNERINCNILINLAKRLDEDTYEGTMNVQATRPVYNSSYTTSLINFIDRDITFSYSQFTPLQFDDGRVTGSNAMQSNLTALLGFYTYLILGLDYDSFAPNGGSDLLKKAQNVVNNAPEQGKTIKGWKAVDGNKNRYWLMDQMMNPRFSQFRSYWYTMHREGLDNMFNKPAEGRKAILDGIIKLGQINRENPNSIIIQFFFNAKSEELMSLVAQLPQTERGNYIGMLQQMDVPNAQKYNSLKQ